MKKALLLLKLFVLLLFGSTQLVSAQNFPVQVIPQVVPPTPIYLSDFANENTIRGPLQAQIVLNALSIANREVRLKVSFEGNGISFESNDIVTGAPLLILEGGIPLTLTNAELAPYFRFENITGISPTAYGQAIPEGTYQFCFEVRDALTNRTISNKSCATTVVFQNEPPILVSPQNRATVENRNPLNIVFQWTPRTINVSNVEYELSIVELWDTQLDPQAAFLASSTFFQTTTTATSYVYNPTDPLLLDDKNYAWRVQAKAKQGTEEIGVFKNQGFSEIYYFGHAQECDLPLAITAEVKGSTNTNILWQDPSTVSSQITIRYRKKGTTAWFEKKTTADFITIWDLEAGTEYEYQIAKSCAIADSGFSTTDTFRTNLFDDDDSTYNCGIAPDIDVTNQVALETLSGGDQFTAGDFPVTILEVNGSNGYFTGTGYVTIPYLKSIKVAVEFTNVFINQNKELAQGNVQTLYDPSLSGIIDPWDFIDDVGDIVNGGDHTNTDPVDFDIDKVEVNGDTIVVSGTDENGNPVEETFPYDEGDTYTVVGNNTVYAVDENGNVNELGPVGEGGPVSNANTAGLNSGGSGTADSPSVATIADNDVLISFSKDPAAKYGWDDVNSSHENGQYPKVQTQNGADLYPMHKAVKNGDTDTFYVDVDLKKEGLTLDDLIFKTITGLEIKTEVAGANRLKVTLGGSGGYRNEEAVITYKASDEQQVVVSSFFIHHLRPLNEVNVTLIPVGGYTASNGIDSELTNVFSSAGANLNVQIGAAYNGSAANLTYTDSGLLTRHPEEFRNFYTEFRNSYSNFSGDTYYVFLFDQNVQPGQNLAGFMPRGTQFGYVFSANISTTGLESKQTVTDVAAHEIGHGVFGISHPADNNLETDWLMDKGKGNQLAKRDWEAIGDDGIQFYAFDEDGDGENVTSTGFFRDHNFLRGSSRDYRPFPFLTPTGETILLPNDIENVEFFYGYYGGDVEGNLPAFLNLIPGTIRSFETYGIGGKYEAKMTVRIDGSILFEGYVNQQGEQYNWEDHKTYTPHLNEGGEAKTWDNLKNVVYAIMLLPSSSGSLQLVKFDRTDATNDYIIGDKSTLNILDLDFKFSSQANIDQDDLVYGEGTYNDELKKGIAWAFKNGSDEETKMLLIKIGELKAVYPEIISSTTNDAVFNKWTNCESKFGLGDYLSAGSFESKLLSDYCDSYDGGSNLLPKKKYRSNGTQIPTKRKEFLNLYFNFLIQDIENNQAATTDILYKIMNDLDFAKTVEINKLTNAITYSSKEEFLILDGEAILRILRRYATENTNIRKESFFKILENLDEKTEQIVYDGISENQHELFFQLNEKFYGGNGFIEDFLDIYTKLISKLGTPEDRISAIEEAVKLKDGKFSDDTEKIVSYLFNNISPGVDAEKIINSLKGSDNGYILFTKIWSILKKERLFEVFNTNNAYATNFVMQVGSLMRIAYQNAGIVMPESTKKYLMKNYSSSPPGVDYLNGGLNNIDTINLKTERFALMLRPGLWTSTVNGSNNHFLFEAKITDNQPPKIDVLFQVFDDEKSKVIIKNNEVNPLEYIYIQFLDDTNVGGHKYNKGDVIAVPAMYLAWMDYMLDAKRNSDAATIAFNSAVIVVSIAAVIPSGGTSLSLLTLAGATVSIVDASTSIALVYSDELKKEYGTELVSIIEIINNTAQIVALPSDIKDVITISKKGTKIIGSGSDSFKRKLDELINSKDGLKDLDFKIDLKALPKLLRQLREKAPEVFNQKFDEVKDHMSNLRTVRDGGLKNFKTDIYDKAVVIASNFYFTKASPSFHLTIDKIKSLSSQFSMKIQDQKALLELNFNNKTFCKINETGELLNVRVYTNVNFQEKTIADFTGSLMANGKTYKNQLLEVITDEAGNPYFKIKFKKGTKRDGDLINAVFERNGQAPPYRNGPGNVEDQVLEIGKEFYVVEYKTKDGAPGGWGSKDPISSIKELREKLAVLEDWKDPSVDDIVIRKYRVQQPIEVRSGPIGQQTDPISGKVYPGGGHQYEFMDHWKEMSFEEITKKIKLIDEQPIR